MAPHISVLAGGLVALCGPSALADSGSSGATQPTGQSLRGATRWGDRDDHYDDRYHDHDNRHGGYNNFGDWRDLLPHSSSLASWGDDDYHDRYHDRYHDHDDYHRGYNNDHGHTGDWRDLLPHASSSVTPEAEESESAVAALVDTEWPFGGHHHHHGHHGWGRRHHGWGRRHHHHHHGWYSLETLGRDVSNSSHMNNSEFWTAIFEDKGLSEAFAGGLSKMSAAARSSWEQDLVAALGWDENLAAAEDWDDQVEREAEQEAHEAKHDVEHVGDRIDRAWDNLAASGDVGDQVEHEAEQEAHEAKQAVDSLAASGDIGDQVEHEAEQEAHEAKQAVDNLAASPETRFWDEVFGDDSSRHSLAAWLVQMGDSQRSEWQQRVSLLATQQGGEAWQPSWGEALQKLAAAQSLTAGGWGWGHHHHHHHHHGRRWGGWGGHRGHYHHHHHGWYSLPEETTSEKEVDEGAGRRLNLV